MNKLLLRLAMLPSGLYQKMGADADQLRAILDVKLKLDDRKPVNFGRQQKVKKDRRFSIALGMFISFFTGLIYTFPLVIPDRMVSLLLFYSMFLFLLTITLITDFSNVLIDTRDKFVVLPRPVNDRTLFLSRMLHVFIYLFRIVLPMALPGWIALGILEGWQAAVWFPVPMLLLVFTALFLVMGVYLLMLQLASASRFKEVLSYFQIAFSIIIFAFYYLVPQAVGRQQFTNLHIIDFGWARWLPSYWLAATFTWIRPAVTALPGTVLLSLLALAFPALCLWVTVRWLAPRFTARLGGIDAVESGEVSPGVQRTSESGSKAYQRLAGLFNTRPEAQAGFIMAWLQTARSRSFKMKIYPMFAYVPIYFVYMMLTGHQNFRQVWHDLPGSARHLALLYMCAIVVLQALSFVTISEQYKAAWVYYATPLKEPGAIMAGAFKAMWVKYFLPFFLTVSIFVLAVWGLPAVWDIVLALVNVTLFAVCMALMGYRKFPFSHPEQMSQSGSKFLRVFISMAIPGTLGLGHYFALHLLWLKLLFLVLSSILLWLVWDSFAHTGWEVVKAAE